MQSSGMILHTHSEASYLLEPQARSRVGGIFFLGNGLKTPPINSAIHVVSQIINNVMASAAEAEVGGLFINGQAACPIQTTLQELRHSQLLTIIVTDNTCAKGISTGMVKQKLFKAMDMQFYWIHNRVKQKQFQIVWRKGDDNLAGYFTKHHPSAHQKALRSIYLHQPKEDHRQTSQQANNSQTTCPIEPTVSKSLDQQNELHSEGVLNNIHSVPHSQLLTNYSPTQTYSEAQHAGQGGSPCLDQ
jgi:hypothetical protein